MWQQLAPSQATTLPQQRKSKAHAHGQLALFLLGTVGMVVVRANPQKNRLGTFAHDSVSRVGQAISSRVLIYCSGS